MPYLLHCFLLLSQNQNSLLFSFFFFSSFSLSFSAGSLPSSCYYLNLLQRNGTKRFFVCDVSRCLIENFHTEHNNFKSILLILLLQNHKKPLEQEEEKQK